MGVKYAQTRLSALIKFQRYLHCLIAKCNKITYSDVYNWKAKNLKYQPDITVGKTCLFLSVPHDTHRQSVKEKDRFKLINLHY